MDNNLSSLKPEEGISSPASVPKTVSTEETAKILGIKPTDVETLVKQELLKETSTGMFNSADLTGIVATRGLSLAQEAAQVGVGLQRAIATSLNVVQTLATVAFAGAVAYGLIVAGFVVAYAYRPSQTASWITQKNPSALQALLQPEGTVALGILKYTQPAAYKQVSQKTIINPNDILTLGSGGSITPNGPLVIPGSSYLQIVSTALIKNLNADFLRGKIPGTTTGDVAVIGQVSGLSDGTVSTGSLADGAVTNAKLATITDANKISGSAVQINGSGGLTNNSGLSLLTTCSDTQVLQWNGSSSKWECATQTGATGAGITSIREAGATIVNIPTAINFGGTDFAVAESPAGVGNITIDYTNSKIVRSDQTESITGTWTFPGGLTLATQTFGSHTLTDSGALSIATTTTGTLTLDSGTTGAVNLGTGANAKVITVGSSTVGTTLALVGGATWSINSSGTLSTTGNVSTTGTGTINSAGVLTASNGLTQTTGAINLTGTSGALALSGLGASSINTGSNTLTLTSSNLNTTSTGINSTAIGASTAAAGTFTSLTSTGTSNIGSGTGVVTLNSSGALNFSGAAPSTWTLGANTLAIISSNFSVDSTGFVTLAGGQTQDLTTAAGTSPRGLTVRPGNDTTNSGTGALLTLSGGNESGTSSVGGNLTLTGGTGTSTNGTINLGTTNTNAITIGATGITTTNTGAFTSSQTLTASDGLNLTTGALNLTGTSGALSLTGLGTSAINAGSNVLSFTSTNFNTTSTGINGTVIGATTPAAGTFTSLTDSGLSASTIVYTDASKNLTSTPPGSGILGFWNRTGTTLSPANSGDAITTSGNISTSATGTITSAGLLTGSSGLTLTTGALNLTGTSGALALSGLTASSINTGATALTITSSNFNTTATGINSTAIGTDTPSTGKFTSLTSTGATDLANAGASNVTIATTGTGTVAIGNATGTFSLTSSGGLNVTTGGALTGVASLDTIGTSATALSFAGTGSVTSATTNAITIDSGSTGDVNLGTGATAKTVTVGNSASTSTTNINSGTGNINLQVAGTGTTGTVQIGAGGAGSTTPDFLALDVKSSTSDPAGGAEGFMYYNTFDNKFRCYENTAWKDCDTTGGTTTLQSAYDAGQTITIAGGKPMSITGADALTLTSGAAATWGTSTGNLNLQVGGSGATANVQIGAGGAGSATPDLLVVDKETSTMPTGTNGAILLDNNGKFNIFESGAWKILCNKTDAACGAGSGTALSAITAATGGNTINSGDNGQDWNWSLTTASNTGFDFGESAASTNGAGNQYILGASTLATSTAAPLVVVARGNKIIDTTAAGGITIGNATAAQAVTIDAGTGALHFGDSANAKAITIGTSTAGTTLALTGGATWSISTAGTLTTSGNVTTTGSGTVTSAGLLTASNGFTQTTGATNITGTSGALTLSGLSASSIATTGGADLNFTSGHFNTTITGINSTAIGTDVPSTGKFTTISASGQITSTLANGTAPFVVASSTNVANLNASSLNGATFAAPGAIGGGTAAAGTFNALTDTGLSANGVVTNTSGGLLGTLAGTTTTVLHGNAGGLPTFSSISGSDLAANITISTTGNISTTGTGTVTSVGLLTASNGLTLTTGAINLTGTSGALSLSGLGASSIDATGNTLTFTSTNFNTTATGINSTAIGTTTPSTGKFTTLTSTGTSNIGSGTGVVTLNSSGALNLTGASPSTWTLGANALTLTSSNFNISSAGVVTLAGGQSADITTLAGTTPTALVFQPGNNTTNSGTGASFTLRGGNNSGTTSTGGNLVLTAGTGTSTNGTITIGTTNTNAITIGATGVTTTNTGALTSTQTLTASNGLTLTTGAINLAGTSGALALSGLGASSIATTGGADLNFTSGHFNTTATGINSTAIGATTAAAGTFTSVTDTGLTASTIVYTDASKVLTSTAPTTGTLAFWNRAGTTLSPGTAGDAITTSGNISTSSTGTITSAGLLTASNGLTLSAGALNLTSTSGALSITGLGASTISATSANLTLSTVTSGTLAVTSAGALNLTGALASTWTLGAHALTLTSSNFNVSSAGAVTLNGGLTADLLTPAATALTIDSGTTGALNIGTGANAKAITIGNNTLATAINITSGTGSQTFTSSNVTGTGASSAFVFNASALTSGTALRLTSTSTSGLLFDQNATNTSGIIDKIAYGAATSLAGATTGLNIDLSTNVTGTTQSLTGISLSLAADTNMGTHTDTGLSITLGAQTQNTAAATGTDVGVDLTMGALTLTTGTALNGHGVRITTGNVTQTAGTLTENGILVDSTASTITTGGTINGVKINAPTTIPSAGTYNNLFLGTSTGSVANTKDQATIAVGNIASTATNNFSTLNITNGGTGYLDVELLHGFINFQGMNTLYDDFTNNTLDTTKWTATVTNGASSCAIGAGASGAAGAGGLFVMTAGAGGANRACELSTKAPGSLSTGYYQRANNPTFETKLSVASLTNDVVYAGFTNTRAPLTSTDTNASTHHAYFAKRSTDTNWQCVTDDGTATESYVDTGVAIVANTVYRLRVEVRNGTTPQTICIVDDGTTITRVTNTAHQPGATSPMDVYLQIDVISNTTAKVMNVDYVRVWQDDPVIDGLAVNSNPVQPIVASESATPTPMPLPVVLANDEISNLLGAVSATPNPDGTDNGLSTLVADIQKETPNDPVTIINKMIIDQARFLTNFIATRITAIRGYFDEVFAKKIHTEVICVKKADGGETCVNGDELQKLLPSPAPTSTPIVSPAATKEPAAPAVEPSVAPSSSETPTAVPTPASTPLTASPTAQPTATATP